MGSLKAFEQLIFPMNVLEQLEFKFRFVMNSTLSTVPFIFGCHLKLEKCNPKSGIRLVCTYLCGMALILVSNARSV